MAATGTRNDPITAFCFRVSIKTVPGLADGQAYFKSVSGLKGEIEVVDYKEGGHNRATRRLVGPTKWPNLVLSRGFTAPPNTPLLNWFDAWINDSGAKVRMTGDIEALDSKLKKICAWQFVGGWPCKWEGPDFDASKQELAIEKIEIAHEGLFFK